MRNFVYLLALIFVAINAAYLFDLKVVKENDFIMQDENKFDVQYKIISQSDLGRLFNGETTNIRDASKETIHEQRYIFGYIEPRPKAFSSNLLAEIIFYDECRDAFKMNQRVGWIGSKQWFLIEVSMPGDLTKLKYKVKVLMRK